MKKMNRFFKSTVRWIGKLRPLALAVGATCLIFFAEQFMDELMAKKFALACSVGIGVGLLGMWGQDFGGNAE